MPLVSALRGGLARQRRPVAGDLLLGHLPDVEVVHLRVPRQLVEVECPERLQPGLVEGAVADHGWRARPRRPGRGPGGRLAGRLLHPAHVRPGPAAGPPRPVPPPRPPRPVIPRKRWTIAGHLVLRQRHQLLQVRHRRELRRGGRLDRLHGRCRDVRRRKVRGGNLVLEQRRVALERRVRALERQPHPPREERVVAVVEGEPLGEARLQEPRPPWPRASQGPCRRAARRRRPASPASTLTRVDATCLVMSFSTPAGFCGSGSSIRMRASTICTMAGAKGTSGATSASDRVSVSSCARFASIAPFKASRSARARRRQARGVEACQAPPANRGRTASAARSGSATATAPAARRPRPKPCCIPPW